jgi:hypothetical protein
VHSGCILGHLACVIGVQVDAVMERVAGGDAAVELPALRRRQAHTSCNAMNIGPKAPFISCVSCILLSLLFHGSLKNSLCW